MAMKQSPAGLSGGLTSFLLLYTYPTSELPISSPSSASTRKEASRRYWNLRQHGGKSELLYSFEPAEQAAEAAAAEGGFPVEDRCLDALKRLRRMPVTTKDLVNTQLTPAKILCVLLVQNTDFSFTREAVLLPKHVQICKMLTFNEVNARTQPRQTSPQCCLDCPPPNPGRPLCTR